MQVTFRGSVGSWGRGVVGLWVLLWVCGFSWVELSV